MMDDSLITKSVLKAFGDRSKLLFCFASALNESNESAKYVNITTSIPYATDWNISLNVSGLTVLNKFISFAFEGNCDQVIQGKGFNAADGKIRALIIYKDENGNLSLLLEVESDSVHQINAFVSNLENKSVNCITTINILEERPDISQYAAFGFDIIQGELPAGQIISPDSIQDFALQIDEQRKIWYSSLPDDNKVFDTIYKANKANKLDHPITLKVSGTGHTLAEVQTDLSNSEIDLPVNVRVIAPSSEYEEGKNYYGFQIEDGMLCRFDPRKPEAEPATSTSYGTVRLGGVMDKKLSYYPVTLMDGDLYVYVPAGTSVESIPDTFIESLN